MGNVRQDASVSSNGNLQAESLEPTDKTLDSDHSLPPPRRFQGFCPLALGNGALGGIIPPLVTPLTSKGALDVKGLFRLLEHVLAGGVHGLFILGTTGEAASLSYTLRRQVIKEVCRQVHQRVPVLVGVSDTSLANTLTLAESADEQGASAVVVSPPYYFRPEARELVDFVRRVADESPLPVYLYNMPELTKTTFTVEIVQRLLEIPRIIGLKDSSGDFSYLMAIRKATSIRQDWSLLVGCESLLAESISAGVHGAIPGGANVWPRLFVQLFEAAMEANVQRCQSLQSSLLKLNQIYGFGGYGVGVIRGLKCALAIMGICGDQMAEPFAKCDDSQQTIIKKKLNELCLLGEGDVSSSRAAPAPHMKSFDRLRTADARSSAPPGKDK